MRPAYPLQFSRKVSMAVFFAIVFYSGVHSAQLPKAKPAKTTPTTAQWSISVQPGQQSKISHPTNVPPPPPPPPSTFTSASPADIRQGNSSGYASTFLHLPLLTSRHVIVKLAFFLPDPFFCNQVHLEHLQRWTRNVARATEELFITGSSSDGPGTTSGNTLTGSSQAKASVTEDSGRGPTLKLSWHPVCRDAAAELAPIYGRKIPDRVDSKAENRRTDRREDGRIGKRYRNAILYNLFQDPDTCVVVSTPLGRAARSRRQGHHRRDVQINLQHKMSNIHPESFDDTGSLSSATSQEVYDGERIVYTWDDEDSEDVQSKDEDNYHDVSSMASILWQKSYIGASGTAAMHDAQAEPVFTLTATISGMGKALAALLDHLKWQHVVILSGKEKYWSEFGTRIFVELTRRNFKVKSFSFDSDKLLLDTMGADKNFSSSDKGKHFVSIPAA